ncbi:YWFCY domain-containing protein [Salmonirosea aquatica]|uniref:TraM recognition domain-containing protein n=1 Tax=Salmonirosea aquatica TaxID=2654236 RepID=A0A7C9FSF9_9BACT|nr:TraM recognition domain-containing protein [Cytophagaceae bacterium SJW1-29]
MGATNAEKEGRSKGVDLLLSIALLFIFLHHYWYNFDLFKSIPSLGALSPTALLNQILVRLDERYDLFLHPLVTKIVVYFLLVLYSIGSRGKIDPSIKVKQVYLYAYMGTILYFLNIYFLYNPSLFSTQAADVIYLLSNCIAIFWIIKAGQNASRIMFFKNNNDIFNNENETFPQNEEFKENDDSIHFKTLYYYNKKWRDGWVNIINPYRSNMILGTPGSGKSFAILVPAIWQSIWKGYTAYIYDFKYPTLTLEAYNAYQKTIRENPAAWGRNARGKFIVPKFYVINFDDIEYSHRCNPLVPSSMTEILDGYQSAATIMLNLNRTWVNKQGDFFVESAINFLTSVIWYMKLVTIKYTRLFGEEMKKPVAQRDSKLLDLYGRFRNVCTFPHILEFACQKEYKEMFTIMASYPQLEAYVRPFASAAQHGAAEQLEGQIASVRIPLARLSSPTLYWIMSGNDFTLDINNPDDPKILCTGNNPERDEVYGAVFSLYTSKMTKLVNKQGKLKSALFWDELPTMFLKGISSLMATARSNKVATWLGFQDFEQLASGYGERESKVIMNLPGNVFSGQVVFESAEKLSRRFGKTQQESENITFGKEETSVTLSTALHEVIPASKISGLSQGEFVGQFADNFGEEINLKTFKGVVRVDQEGMKKTYAKPPVIKDIAKLVSNYYPDEKYEAKEKESWKARLLDDNYRSIKREVAELIRLEYMEFQIKSER